MHQNFKIVPTPTFKNKILNKKSINIQIAEMLENILNGESKQGWEFVDIKTVVVPIKKSFFNSSNEKKISVLVFKKSTTDVSLISHNSSSGNDNYPSLGPATKD